MVAPDAGRVIHQRLENLAQVGGEQAGGDLAHPVQGPGIDDQIGQDSEVWIESPLPTLGRLRPSA